MSMGGPPDVPGGGSSGATPGDTDPGALQKTNNLSDVVAATARANLALGSLATANSVAHSATTGQTANDHHAQLHAAAHAAAGSDDATSYLMARGAGMPAFLKTGSGLWYPTQLLNSTSTAATLGNQTLRLTPWQVPNAITLAGMALEITAASNGSGDPARTVTDGVLNSTTTITSATAAFVSQDVGRMVTGTGIPANTYIHSFTNSTTVVLTQAATSTASGVSLTISGPIVRLVIYNDDGTGYPSSLVLDCGISGTANTNGGSQFATSGAIDAATIAVQAITVSKALTPNNYWVGAIIQGVKTTQPTIRTGNSYITPIALGSAIPAANATTAGYSQTGITDSAPDPFLVVGSITTHGGAARILVKVT